jgi:hypothetical protein
MSPATTASATLTDPSGTPTASSAFAPRLTQMFYRITLFALFDSA